MMPLGDPAPQPGGDSSERTGTPGAIARRRLMDNILSLYALLGLYYLIPMAVLPYLVRVLGMEMYGLVAFAQSFAQYFTTLTDYGFNYSATRSIAQQREDHNSVSKIFCSVKAHRKTEAPQTPATSPTASPGQETFAEMNVTPISLSSHRMTSA